MRRREEQRQLQKERKQNENQAKDKACLAVVNIALSSALAFLAVIASGKSLVDDNVVWVLCSIVGFLMVCAGLAVFNILTRAKQRQS